MRLGIIRWGIIRFVMFIEFFLRELQRENLKDGTGINQKKQHSSALWGSLSGSIPVRVTIQCSRKQRNIAVSEFFFYTENRVCPLLVRYSDFAADILILCCCILRKKTERSVHRLSHPRLCGLEHSWRST